MSEIPCVCGSRDAYWHGDTRREYCCDECWKRAKEKFMHESGCECTECVCEECAENDSKTIFYATCEGDPSVGIPGDQAIIQLWVPPNDPEFLQFAKKEIEDCFRNIWDDTSTRVLTEEECKEENEAEEKFFDDELLNCIIDDEDAIKASK